MDMTVKNSRIIALWLGICCALVFVMVLVGAITRLSNSGLSITEWKPLLGAIPPLNEAEWERAFGLYQKSPEFRHEHYWMEMADFKKIFFWEWYHRLLGRLIGLAYGLPLLVFWLKGMIPKGYKLKLAGLFVLGGMQGALGWYMVKSGLVDMPSVSHYRLAAHLSLALVIYALMFWLMLTFRNAPRSPSRHLYVHGWVVLVFVVMTMVWGAFTAGLDAGLIYNTFPLFSGQFLPPDMWHRAPAWINIFENQSAVQFTHRWLAVSTVLMVLGLWVHAFRKKSSSPVFHALAVMAVVQMMLGIATLLSGVNLHLAVTHQAGAVVTLTLLLAILHRTRA